MQETAKIWMNGELVDWADATVHVGVHGLHYGTGAFEGIRAYETSKGPAVFRLAEHMQRLHDSAKLLYMELPYTVEELRSATHDLVRANGLPAAYIRPIAFFGYGSLGVHTRGQGPGDTRALPYIEVDDIEATAAKVREFGGTVIHPGERWTICKDSEGSPFALAQTRSAPEPYPKSIARRTASNMNW